METLNLTIDSETKKSKEELLTPHQLMIHKDNFVPLSAEERRLSIRQVKIGHIGTIVIGFLMFASILYTLDYPFSESKLEFSKILAAIVSTAIWGAFPLYYFLRKRKKGDMELRAGSKRILIEPVGRLFELSNSYRSNSSKTLFAALYPSNVIWQVPLLLKDKLKVGDFVEVQFIQRSDGSRRVIQELSKVSDDPNPAPGEEETDISPATRQQVFHKNETVVLTEEDRRFLKKEIGFRNKSAVIIAGFALIAVFLCNYWDENHSPTRLILSGIGFLGAGFLVLLFLIGKSDYKKGLADNKKRVIIAPVVELDRKNIASHTTKYFVSLDVGGEIIRREIPMENYMKLQIGDTIELHLLENPSDKPLAVREIAKIAGARTERIAEPLNYQDSEIV